MVGASAPSGGARRRGRIAQAASLAVAALGHVLVLGLLFWQTQMVPEAAFLSRQHLEPSPPLHLRTLTDDAAPASGEASPAPSTLATLSWPSDAAVAESASRGGEIPALPPEILTAPEPLYLPRALLNEGPVVRDAVLLAWPTQTGLRGIYRGVLRLFIDEQGQVRRVEAADEELPDLLLEVARRAFMAARFDPGQLDGRPVRSLIRVEVSFESEPLPLAHE